MRRWLIVVGLGVAALGSSTGPRATAPAPVKLLVPAYFYPAGPGVAAWNKLDAAAARVPVVAIANPNSGPGAQDDPTYTATLNKAQQAGVTLIGYVSTSYGNRSLEAVKADIDVWPARYPQISGFFLDEQASGAAKVDHYGEIYDYIKSQHPGYAVYSNPGTVCDSTYLTRPATDTACLFESKHGFAAYIRPAWASMLVPDRTAALAYSVKQADNMRQFLKRAQAQGVGYFYVSDRAGADPWNGLPTYWRQEVAAVKRLSP
jgi:hypothetical protein